MGGQGMAWILLAAYTCMLAYNAGFCYWAFEFAGNSNDSNSNPIEESTTDSVYPTDKNLHPETTYDNRLRRDVETDGPYEYYNYSDYPETYVFLSCGTSAIVALTIIVAGLFSRAIFNTTMPEHSSILTVMLHLGTVITVLYNDNLSSNIWIVIGSNVGAVLLNGQQVLLNVIHLRRQNIPIVTFNLNEVLSINSIFFILRTVFSAVVLNSFFFSSFWSGSSDVFCPGKHCIYSNYGIASAFFCSIAALVGLILNTNGFLSFAFGSFHHSLVTVSTLLLACAYAVMCVLVSPLFTSSEYTGFSTDPLLLAITCTLLHAIHLILMCFPKHLSTNVFRFIVTSRTQEERGFLNFCRRLFNKTEDSQNRSKCFWQNLALSIVSQVAIVLSAISLSQNGCWCNALLVATAASLFSRSSVMALSQVLTANTRPNTIFQKLSFLVLEGTATLVALVAACVDGFGLSILAAAFLSIAYILLAIDVCTSSSMKSLLEQLLPSHPILETTIIHDSLPSGSRPHQSEVDENDHSNLVLHPEEE